jgi:hypothetical protein
MEEHFPKNGSLTVGPCFCLFFNSTCTIEAILPKKGVLRCFVLSFLIEKDFSDNSICVRIYATVNCIC